MFKSLAKITSTTRKECFIKYKFYFANFQKEKLTSDALISGSSS